MTANGSIESRLWSAADQLRANSGLKASDYSVPVLGLIFLAYADARFSAVHEQLQAERGGSRRRGIEPIDYQARGVLYLPEEARFQRLLNLTEGDNIGEELRRAMHAIEEHNPELRDVLPKTYGRLDNRTLIELLRLLSTIPMDIEGDVFGRIYEYFLGEFAMSEGQKGGEFYTPTSIVRLIVEILEPFHGKILDPACGSGGMFVQSARFVERHSRKPNDEISIYGQERIRETARLCRMNLAVHGLSGQIREGNTYYQDIHNTTGQFDFVMANPPFNVNAIDKERLEGDRRFPFGLPTVDNGNYIWIQLFYSALNERGRAGFVMANSASDARGSEQEIRRKLIESGAVDVMIAISSNFFYTVTLPCTLWFLDRGKVGTEREDKVLFIDARQIYRQVDRAHRDFRPDQLEFLANIVRLYRGEEPESESGSDELMGAHFPAGEYVDVPGLCKVATRAEIEAQGWSLNPGRYVGIAPRPAEEFEFAERLEQLYEELDLLTAAAHELEDKISEDVIALIEAAS